MTRPITSHDSHFDTSQFYGDSNSCDPAAQSCKSSRTAAPAASPGPIVPEPRAVTLETNYVVGEAGADKLFNDYCAAEKIASVLACGKAVTSAVSATSSAMVPVLFAAGLANTVFEGVACGKELVALYDCETEPR
jgi:hypothetical protein